VVRSAPDHAVEQCGHDIGRAPGEVGIGQR
jgi:hypothetical protein